MTRQSAQSAVVLSAFWVALLFGYRKLTEPSVSPATVPNTAHFVIGFGFTYLVLATIAQAAPALGGMFAILVATGDTLANGKAVFADITKALQATTTATSPSPAPTVFTTPASRATAANSQLLPGQ